MGELLKWQDYINTGVGIAFNYALVPQVIYGFKDKVRKITRQTGIVTSVGLSLIVVSEYTLGLRLAPVITAMSCGLWGMLTAQAFKYPTIEEKKKLEQIAATEEDLNDRGIGL